MGMSGICSRVHDTLNTTSCQEIVACVRIGYMEIAFLAKNSLRLKGKKSSFIVDPEEKMSANGFILLNESGDRLFDQKESVIIQGPGEYEIGGVKLSGYRTEGNLVFNFSIDGVEILLGKLTSLEKMQHKLKEQHVVIAYVDEVINSSFINSLATNLVVFYGNKSKEVIDLYGKANVTSMQKYSITLDKLPQEVETIILQ